MEMPYRDLKLDQVRERASGGHWRCVIGCATTALPSVPRDHRLVDLSSLSTHAVASETVPKTRVVMADIVAV